MGRFKVDLREWCALALFSRFLDEKEECPRFTAVIKVQLCLLYTVPKTAIYIGSATIDINATSSALETVCSTHHHHRERFAQLSFASKTLLDDVCFTTGGSAANSAYTSKLLGSGVDLVSGVGGDEFGKMILSDLKQKGVLTRHVSVFPQKKTSLGINIICRSGEKTNLVYKGATDALSEKNLSEACIRSADAVVLTSLASKTNFPLFKKAVRLAQKHKKFTVFAPSITMLRSRKKELTQMKSQFDVVVMNAEEASYFAHCRDVISSLNKLPGTLRIVTSDVDGTYIEQFGRVWHIPTLRVNVKDTTGAGDAFTGALVHALLHHGRPLEAVQLATATACFNIQQVGAKVHGSKNQIHAYFRKNRSKLAAQKMF